MSVNQQDIKTGDFIIHSDDNIPVYNALKASYEPGIERGEDFTVQFELPQPDRVEYVVDVPVFLQDFTYRKPETSPISVFTNVKIQQFKRTVKKQEAPEAGSEMQETHSFNVLQGKIAKTIHKANAFENLRPVPLVKLTAKQQSYTHQVNEFLRYNPSSKNRIEASDGMIGIVIGFTLFFLYMRMIFGRYMDMFFGAVFNRLRAHHMQEESGLILGRISFLLNIFFFFTIGLFVQQILDFQGLQLFELSQLKSLLFLTGVVASIYLLKWLFANILGHFLQIQSVTKSYFFHTFIYNKVFALVSFPLLLALPYIDSSWVAVLMPAILVFLAVMYFFRFFRVIVFSIQRKLSLFYLFLYLCALEIIPILIGYNLVDQWLRLPFF
jgi:hypothetical protein